MTAAGCSGGDVEGNALASTTAARPVLTQVVQTGAAVQSLRAVGTLQGVNEIAVYPKTAERIVTLRVREGERVRKGKVLAVLASDLQSRSVRQAEAGLSAAESGRDALQDEVTRVQALVKAGAAAPSQLSSLQSQLRTSEAQVSQMAAGLSIAAAQQRQAVITAPIDGSVANLHLREGDLATPTAPLCVLVSDTRLKVVLQLAERDFLQVQPAMRARVSLLGDVRSQADGTVTLRSAMIDARTRTGRIEIAIDDPSPKLIPGAAVRAVIELERQADALLVPASSLVLDARSARSGQATVFVVEDGSALARRVQLGPRLGETQVIASGLQVGEILIVRGQHLLRDGEAVHLSVASAVATVERPAVSSPEPVAARRMP